MKIAYLTFGSSTIGMGHIYRGLAIADFIKKHRPHWRINFFLIGGSDQPCALLSSRGFASVQLNSFAHYTEDDADVIIVDRLQNQPSDLVALKSKCRYLVSIDDASLGHYSADLAINPLYDCQSLRPQGSTTLSWIGPKHALIPEHFSQLAYQFRPSVENILIMQGSSDPHNLLQHIVPAVDRAVCERTAKVNLHLVTAATFPWAEALAEVIPSLNSKVLWHKAVKNPGELFCQMDLAISSAGVTAHELAACGVPTILITGEAKEVETAQQLDRAKAACCLGFYNEHSAKLLGPSVQKFLTDTEMRWQMSKMATSTVDAGAINRLITHIEACMLKGTDHGTDSSIR